MKNIAGFFLLMLISCSKDTSVTLPEYSSELNVEMYLEEDASLKCIVSETLPYASETVTQLIDSALVILSDGIETDTLTPAFIYDYESGRKYNYASPRIFKGDASRIYTLTVTDSLHRQVKATTGVPGSAVKLASVFFSPSAELPGKYSIGFSFNDPAGTDNYYRAMIGKGVNNYTSSHTDFLLPDLAFAGKEYSFNSEAGYERGDTVAVRLYSLLKDHYDFLQSTQGARTANSNPFMQPVMVKSNISGGYGIFTAIRYDERNVIVR